MHKTSAIGLLLAGLAAFPAFAEDCGRWVPCAPDGHFGAARAQSYIYGNSRDVEPWAEDDIRNPAAQRTAPREPALGAGDTARAIALIDEIALENEAAAGVDTDLNRDVYPEDAFDGEFDLSPEEEAAMRAYLAKIDTERGAESAFGVSGREVPTELQGVRIIEDDDR